MMGVALIAISVAVVIGTAVGVDALVGWLLHRIRVRNRLKALRENPRAPDLWGLRR